MYHVTTWVTCGVVLSICVGFGVVGNLVSIAVLSLGPRSIKMPITSYFRFVAICDVLMLLTSGIAKVSEMIGNKLNNKHVVLCKAIPFFAYFVAQMSGLLLVAITIERTLVMCFPLKSQQLSANMKRRSVVIFVLILVSSLGLNSIVAIDFSIRHEPVINSTFKIYCRQSFNLYVYSFIYDVIFYNVVTFAVPIVTIVVCNSVMLTVLYRSRFPRAGQSERNNHFAQLTRIVIAYGVMYIITMFPWFFVLCYKFHIITLSLEGISHLYAVSSSLNHVNSAVNCYLYCFLGGEFRKDVREMAAAACRYYRCRTTQRSDQCVSPPRVQTAASLATQSTLAVSSSADNNETFNNCTKM